MDERGRKARDIQRVIGELLLTRWDPLGVADEPEASGEYEAYIGPVYRLLANGASDRKLAEHLVAVETRSLGYPDSEWRMLVPVARKLRKAFARLSSGSAAT